MDIYTSIKKEILENARARAIVALGDLVKGDNIEEVMALVDEIRELDDILKEHAELERWKSGDVRTVLLKQE